MIYFLSLFVTCCGLAECFNRLFRTRRFWGLHFAAGLLTYPVLIYFLNIDFGVPLSHASWGILGVATLGWMSLVTRKEIFKMSFWTHPVILLPLILFVAWVLAGQFHYVIHEWDEFSHWMTLPRMVFSSEKATSTVFPYNYFIAPYTPGWALMMDYPLFFDRRDFADHFFIFIPVFTSVALIGITYDAFKSRIGSTIWIWIVLLLLMRLRLAGNFFVRNMLIELPLENVMACVIVMYFIPELTLLHWGAVTGISIAAGYLLKKTFACVLLPAVYLFWMRWRKSGAGFSRHSIFALMGLILPFFLVAVSWNSASAAYIELFPMLGQAVKTDLFHHIFSADSFILLQTMAVENLKIFFSKPFYLTGGVLGCIIAFRNREFRPAVAALTLLLFIYFTALFWLYRTSFGEGSIRSPAAFERYTTSIWKPVLYFFFVVLFYFIVSKDGNPRPYMRSKHLTVFAFAVAVVIFGEQLQFFLHDHGTREPSLVSREAPFLKSHLAPHQDPPPTVILIYQDQGYQQYWEMRSLAFDHDLSLRYRSYFSATGAISFFGPHERKSDDPWAGQFTENELSAHFLKANIIWPARVSRWMAGVLSRTFPNCSLVNNWESVFVINGTCVVK